MDRMSDVFAQAVISVNELHSRRTFSGDGYSWSVCAECRQAWPCMTQKALRALIPAEELDGHETCRFSGGCQHGAEEDA
jgi:hypothetical protein